MFSASTPFTLSFLVLSNAAAEGALIHKMNDATEQGLKISLDSKRHIELQVVGQVW